MRSINAHSGTQNVCDWLANSCQPRILHVFEHACNLINERREVLSVVAPQIGAGPFNLLLEEDICFSNSLRLESPVSVSAHQLTLGDLTIQTGQAKCWSPRPDWERLQIRRTEILNPLPSLPISITQPLLPHSLLSNLSSALVTEDISSTQKITSQLAGLGAGLTPAGDDFLLGSMYAAWIIHPPEVAKILAEGIANIAAPLTTSLSAAWLRAGSRGEAGAVWHEFFEALIAADSAQTQNALEKILAVGETSGADALSGFLGTFAATTTPQIPP